MRQITVVGKAIEILKSKLPGLGFNLGKCPVVGKCEQSLAHVGFVGTPQVSIEAGSVFLGVPVGEPAITENHIAAVAGKTHALLAKLSQLDSSLAKFLILRASFGACRINQLAQSLAWFVDTWHCVEICLRM